MTDTSTTPAGEYEAQFGDYFALMKPRVMQLVVFTALVGMLAAPVPVHPVIGFASILFVAIGAGASGALNMWWDADIDAIMRRTQGRPIPSGMMWVITSSIKQTTAAQSATSSGSGASTKLSRGQRPNRLRRW